MMLTARHTSVVALTAAIALTLSACGSSHNNSSPASSGSIASPAASAPAAAHSAPAAAASAKAPAAAATAPAVAASAPAASTAAAASSPVTLALGNAISADHRVSKASTHFSPSDKAIYASVSTNGKSLGGTLNAKWTYLEGKKPLLISSVSQLIPSDSPSSTTFTVRNPNPWPQGHYSVEISLDGKSLTSQAFEIH